MSDLYETLGVSPQATPEEIKKAGRKAQKRTHPDAGGDRAEFEAVQRALTVLMDPGKREHYDATGEAQEGSQEALELREAHACLKSAMDAAMQDQDPRYVDLVEGVLSTLCDTRRAFQNERNQQTTLATRELERQRQFLKRLKKKGGGESAMADLIKGRINEIERSQAAYAAKVAQKIRIVELAIGMAEGHEYAAETKPMDEDDLMELLDRQMRQTMMKPGFFRPF